MNLSTFFDNAAISLGQIYALEGNGYYYSNGCWRKYARAKLAVLRSYMQSLNTEVLGVMLFGSAVQMPTDVIVKRKKWGIFGPVIESTVKQHVNAVNDFDFVIFTKDSQMPLSAPGLVIDGYDFYAIHSSGLHMMCLTPEEYQAGIDTGDSVATSLRDNGVMIMRSADFPPSDIGNPMLQACWELDAYGEWHCRIKTKE
jgi:hypothetical protein